MAKVRKIQPNPGPQLEFLASRADIAIFGGAAGGGKAINVETPIPTPDGWVAMGDLTVGDHVLDERGRPCLVTGAHPVHENLEAFRVIFDDGSEIEACADHLWLTFDAKELARITRNDQEWRRRRREQRPSRATGLRSQAFTDAVIARNRRLVRVGPAPSGSVRTTAQIHMTIRTASGRSNHAVPVAAAMELPERVLPIHPYVLGVWLGDGTATSSGVTGVDLQIFTEVERTGETVRHHKHPHSHAISGLVTRLRPLGLLGNKHIPSDYLRASAGQRLALLEGLMDTDGTVCDGGSVEFTNTNRRLAEAVHELIVGLGWKARMVEGRSTLNGVDCGPKWDIKWTPDRLVFRLTRKATKQRLATRRTTRFRYIVGCEPITPKPMRCITVDSQSRLYLCGRSMIPTHNTYGMLLDPLKRRDVDGFEALILRRVGTQITLPGGLWSSSVKLYPWAGGVGFPGKRSWRWPNGFSVTFRHLEDDVALGAMQGAQIPYIGFDELTHFTRDQFVFMLSRNRSVTGIPGRIRATCNADATSWVKEFIRWWLDSEGRFPDKAKAGVLRWMAREGDEFCWYASREEAEAQHGPNSANSVTFIPARITDNAPLLEADPAYLTRLRALGQVMRQRLEMGDWLIRQTAGTMFRRDWFPVIEAPPAGGTRVRYWDRACLVPGTMIATDCGQVPIENVKRGDRVLTRKGFRRVEWAGITKIATSFVTIETNGGNKLTGTPEHPVWTKETGWIRLDSIAERCCSMHICQRDLRDTQQQKSSSSKESSTDESKESDTTKRSAGLRLINDTGQTHCIVLCGEMPMALFRRCTTFITRTATGITTRWKTWSASAARCTTRFITRSENGTNLLKQRRSEMQQEQSSGSINLTRNLTALCVANHSNQDGVEYQSIAQCVAITLPAVTVYDLQVEGAHEFFANGILVHNSTKAEAGAGQMDGPDWTVGVRMARHVPGRFVVEDVVRLRGTPAEVERAIRNTAEQDGRGVTVCIEQDPGQSGVAEAGYHVRALAGWNVRTFPVTRSKVTRASPFSAQVEAGNVSLVRGAWNNPYLSVLEAFPDGAKDDDVDASSGAFNVLTSGATWQLSDLESGQETEARSLDG